MESETKGPITLAELQASPEYLACTPKMQVWLTTLIESNFDYKLATATAFNCKNLRQAHVFSYAVRKWPVIRAALNLYLGRSEQDVFLEDLKETIRRAPKGSVAQVRAQALYARLKFGVSEGSAEPEAKSESPAAAVESKAPVSESRIPAGAYPLYDKTSGALQGYRTTDGQYIRLADVEVTR
jgi:hypothetical protein